MKARQCWRDEQAKFRECADGKIALQARHAPSRHRSRREKVMAAFAARRQSHLAMMRHAISIRAGGSSEW
ncbi:hypothetical protein F3P66_17205 [Agrobacterium fabrum]|uniref:Uncharacterized protein n=1 Tax=Agrobacterium fabrum (strain C58 / ATCC 33970) TaxID=176299 RepID=Q8UA38_AGRFC|nr:hypothetical protein Atu3537 [Agrobacterium fabrum str. C58]QKW99673.1 hypothetical protein GSF67_21460 [Agrobacterium sp. CGMCC 11546]QRM61191.1 hypothetical protein F3P66_17205 [Agrobacterium fabrum]TRB30113.1 hypothetical protein EXN51_10035 [Agrobacterium fabrum]